ncbi:Uncharacterized protein APZ42_027487 [Daphnia magna]|uniref:Uncharacterized protein n=1 Tax=Daphnia magna TaxID=35525 RepID=A0A164RMG1_9CRUS|nr:Uncharacterized protein APZ42_027487 [Daphnia magna]
MYRKKTSLVELLFAFQQRDPTRLLKRLVICAFRTSLTRCCQVSIVISYSSAFCFIHCFHFNSISYI